MKNIFFLLRSLETGGAERQLVELVRNLDRSRFAATIAIFYDSGDFRREVNDLPGVRLVSLGKRGRWDTLGFFIALVREIRSARAQLVHGFLDVPDIFAWLAGRLAGTIVVFGVRDSNMDYSRYDWTARATHNLAALLSHFSDLVIYNSQAGMKYHQQRGFSRRNGLVIANGIQTDRFQPNPTSGQALRAEWGVSSQETLLGLIGRLDPMKGPDVLLQAAAQVAEKFPRVRFVCVGGGRESYRAELASAASRLGLTERVIWAGIRSDMPAVYNALDLLVSASSYGEGFSNVIAEAMSCGIPCLVTDVGDSAAIVAETGLVVLPNDPQALSKGMAEFLSMPAEQRRALGLRGRQRIAEEFSIETMVKLTEQALSGLLPGGG